jgi:branched-chain amino acid transport system ATP-binding protein
VSALLEVEAVGVAYGKRRALEGVSLSVGHGEIVTLLGANGAGKSTTLKTISGLVRPARGRIVYQGDDITRTAPDVIVARGIAHVPEARQIFPEFTVRENLLVGGHTRRRTDELREGIARAERLFPILAERAGQRAATLSGGEQQMLAIARGLMARPRLLLLDEPSLGLAPLVVREIFRVIREINAAGVGILLVEQDARLALGVAARGYVLETGRVVVQGASATLAGDPRIRQAYLGLGETSA